MLAGAISSFAREGRRTVVTALGASAANQAIKAIAISRKNIEDEAIDITCKPEFTEIEDGKTALRMLLLVEQAPLRPWRGEICVNRVASRRIPPPPSLTLATPPHRFGRPRAARLPRTFTQVEKRRNRCPQLLLAEMLSELLFQANPSVCCGRRVLEGGEANPMSHGPGQKTTPTVLGSVRAPRGVKR